VTDTVTLQETGDAELISAVRGGDLSAYGPLFERHVEAARRLARQLVGQADADDLVSDAFAKVLRVLQGGGGPDVAFRAYLLTSIRRLHVDKIRANSRLHSTDDMEAFDPGVPFRDTAVEGFESAAAAKAFASLPERWQAVLWHTEVEGQKPAEVAALLGMTPNSVSALAYRAREGLRQAFLNSHAMDVDDDACAWTHQHLGGYIRNGISKRDAGKVEKHIDECRKCMAIYLELTEVNNNLAAILAPLLLGGAGIGYLATAGAASKGAFLLFLDRVKDGVTSNGPATAATGVVAAGVVVAGTVFALQAGGDKTPPPRADAPAPPAATAPADTAPPADTPPPADEPVDDPVDAPSATTAPTATPTPTTSPTAEPTTTPTEEPTVDPTPTPTPIPTDQPAEADVTFSGTLTPSEPSDTGTSTVAVTVAGIPEGETVEVAWSGANARTAPRQYLSSASETAAPTPGVAIRCSEDDCVLTADRPSLILTGTVTGDQPQLVTITLKPSFTDPDSGDNSVHVTFKPAPVVEEPEPTPYDVSVAVTTKPGGGNAGKYDATVAGLPSGLSGTLTVTVPVLIGINSTLPANCESEGWILGSRVTCTNVVNSTYDFDFDALLSGSPTFTIEGNPSELYTEPENAKGNNTVTAD
jgi:RNA polymerase sigma factor (sigma-70 family)